MMSREFNVIIERDSEGYYVGSVPALKGCHSQAKSLDELMVRIREAIELCLEAQGQPPLPTPLERSGDGVPVHAGEIIGPGLLAKILRDCDLTREQFLELV